MPRIEVPHDIARRLIFPAKNLENHLLIQVIWVAFRAALRIAPLPETRRFNTRAKSCGGDSLVVSLVIETKCLDVSRGSQWHSISVAGPYRGIPGAAASFNDPTEHAKLNESEQTHTSRQPLLENRPETRPVKRKESEVVQFAYRCFV